MKRILLFVALILAQFTFAQREGAITAYLSVDQPSTIGVSGEFPENGKLRDFRLSRKNAHGRIFSIWGSD